MKKYIIIWILAVTAFVTFAIHYKPLSSHPNFREQPAIVSDNDKYNLCVKSQDCLLLATAAYFEGRSEPDEGIYAIMAVVKNRAMHPTSRWPKTTLGVLKQKCEFSFVCDKSMYKPLDTKAFLKVGILAYNVQNGLHKLPSNYHYYHSTKMKKLPVFAQKYDKVKVIGTHAFYSCQNYKYC